MTRSATAARVANSRDFRNGVESSGSDLAFNRTFRNEKARADQRFVTGPLVTRRLAELANRRPERVDHELRTVFSVCCQTLQTFQTGAQVNYRSFSRSFTDDLFSQQRSGSYQNRAAHSSKLRLRHDLRFIDLDSEADVGATDYRRGTPCKARAICIADITRIEEMIGNCCW